MFSLGGALSHPAGAFGHSIAATHAMSQCRRCAVGASPSPLFPVDPGCETVICASAGGAFGSGVAVSRCLECPTGGHGTEPALAGPAVRRLSSLKIDPLQGLLCSRARRKPGPLSFIFCLGKERQKKLFEKQGRKAEVVWDGMGDETGGQVFPGVMVLIHGDEQGEPVAPGARCSDLWDESCWVSSDLQLCFKVIALHIFREPHSSRLPCGCRAISQGWSCPGYFATFLSFRDEFIS